MIDLSVFQTFCNEFEGWSFASLGADLYILAYNFINQSYLDGFDPDLAVGSYYDPIRDLGRKQPGPMLYFYDYAVESLVLNSESLVIQVERVVHVCNGVNGTIDTSPV